MNRPLRSESAANVALLDAYRARRHATAPAARPAPIRRAGRMTAAEAFIGLVGLLSFCAALVLAAVGAVAQSDVLIRAAGVCLVTGFGVIGAFVLASDRLNRTKRKGAR